MPLAYRYNVPGEHLEPGAEVDNVSPGAPVSLKASRPRLSSDIQYYHTGYEAEMEKENQQFHPLDIAPHASPDPIRKSDFVGRPARNPSHAFTYWPAYPDGRGWQEDRFIESFDAAHDEFYPGTKPSYGDTFLYDAAEQRHNLPYSRPSSYGEQTAYMVDEAGLLYQDLSTTGGY